jgi:hydroxyethylthiazole kinase-like uncharacterized protein yjeF
MMKLVMAEEMRALDRASEEEIGIPGLLLMENAGHAVAEAAMAMLQNCAHKKVLVFAGKGNNGGDGFGAARWLQNQGALVTVFLTCTKEELSGSAADEMQFYLAGKGELFENISRENLEEITHLLVGCDLVIDALLGTGFAGALRGVIKELCHVINEAQKPVLAVDIPTGVNADDGSADEDAIRADVTVTMALPKPGLYLYPGRKHSGDIKVADIGMPASMLTETDSKGYILDEKMVAGFLPKRPANMHKGTAGRVLVVAGSPGYTGAAALCCTACVKAGAGLVTLLTPASGRAILAVKLTETMVKALPEAVQGTLASTAAVQILQEASIRDVLAIGPGIGTAEGTASVIIKTLEAAHVPCVIDADALTALVNHTDMLTTMTVAKIMTPHPGELARLVNMEVSEIEKDRINIAVTCAKDWQAVVVLKGVPTVVASPDGTYYLNPTGNASMATGGSGDVLTGIIAALVGQGLEPAEAAAAGVYLHGLAGDEAAHGKTGLAAGEIADAFPKARYRVENNL